MWRIGNSYIVDCASGRISVGVGLAVDEFSERVELGAKTLSTLVIAANIAELVESEAPDLEIRVLPKLTCHGSHDHRWIFRNLAKFHFDGDAGFLDLANSISIFG